jgi:hypothetical protein
MTRNRGITRWCPGSGAGVGGIDGPKAGAYVTAGDRARGIQKGKRLMSNAVYKKVELVGTSGASISDAINNAIASASVSFGTLGWFEVQEIRGNIQDGKVSQYQVVVKVGYRIES